MGLFDRLFKKTESEENIAINTEPGKIYAPITGKYIPLEQIPDPVFSQEILGPGCGIEPQEGKVYAPVNGEISMVADTKHAVAIRSEDNIELLIHVGIDTVSMNGKGFDVKVMEGQKVTCGSTLMLFDMEEIKNAGFPSTVAFLVTNGMDYSEVKFETDKEHAATEAVGMVR